MACSSFASINCDCTTTSLSPIAVNLPKNGNDFPFIGLYGNGTVQVEGSDAGIAISTIPNFPRLYIGYSGLTFVGNLVSFPAVFNAPIPGSNGALFYNNSTGEITIPANGVYTLNTQFTIGSLQYLAGEYGRIINITVNGISVYLSYKVGTSEFTSVSASYQSFYNAGDVVLVRVSVSSQPGVTSQISGGVESYLSFV